MDHTTKEIIPGQVYLSVFPDGVRVASVTSPYFCVARKTESEALKAAQALLAIYSKWKAGKTFQLAYETEPYVSPGLPIRHFEPQKVVKVRAVA